MFDKYIDKKLSDLAINACTIQLHNNDKYIIFSDFHLGDGSKMDDFVHNESMITEILKSYYLKNDYSLLLNGDVEELQKFHYYKIRKRCNKLHELFDSFNNQGRLYKNIGNHDYSLITKPLDDNKFKLYHAIKLISKKNTILIFHGFQATIFFTKFYPLTSFLLRYIASPLKIKNFEAASDNYARFLTEKRIYDFSRKNKIISIIGHTHRPIFESLSKIDSLKFEIDRLCREYPVLNYKDKAFAEKLIKKHLADYYSHIRLKKKNNIDVNIYNPEIVVPSIFNSGCVIGKRGITGIELSEGMIKLVHWFNINKSSKYLASSEYKTAQLNNTEYYKVVLKEEYLDYIFTRINLLA